MSTTIPLLCAALSLVGGPAQADRYGYLNQPAYSIDKKQRLPMTAYQPQPGDVILFSDPNLFWGTLYAIAMTSAPGHVGLVVRMNDGELGIVEAGYDDKPQVRLIPLEPRLPHYKGNL